MTNTQPIPLLRVDLLNSTAVDVGADVFEQYWPSLDTGQPQGSRAMMKGAFAIGWAAREYRDAEPRNDHVVVLVWYAGPDPVPIAAQKGQADRWFTTTSRKLSWSELLRDAIRWITIYDGETQS